MQKNNRTDHLKIMIFMSVIIITLSPLLAPGSEKPDALLSVPPHALIVATGSINPEGFDPTQGWGRYGNPLFQSTLLRRDEHMAIVPDLAETYTLSSDGLCWHIRIRKDALFTDGTKVTARDVAFTCNQAAKSAGKTDMSLLDTAVATSDHDLSIYLKHAASTFIFKLTTLGIVPEHAYGEDYARNPMGSGPYRLVKWDEGQQLIVEANPLYYGNKPMITRIVFMEMNEQTAFAAAKAGRVHLVRVPQALAIQKIKGMKRHIAKSVDNRGLCFPVLPSGQKNTSTGLMVGNSVTADLSIRKAINYVVDRQALVAGILEGFGSPCQAPATGLPWDEEGARIQDGDLNTARKILKQDGWQDEDQDGVLSKNGLKAMFTIYYPADDSIRQALAIAVSDRIREIGIQADVIGKSWDDIYKLMHANVVLFGFGSLDPLEIYRLYRSSSTTDDVYNAGCYQNPVVDQYLDQALYATSEKEAISFWKKAQWDGQTGFTAKGDAAWCWLVNLDHTYFADERLVMGELPIEPHENGMNITATILSWKWIDDQTTSR
ncbi:MAG: ABC transporter substrate-binding protein [Proteobacteria bacterium]|nr:ABC transporter substrate-binding protein [Pseudomonadota bacterium]